MRVSLRPWVIPTGIGVASFGAGVGVGYFLIYRRFHKKIDIANVNIEELKEEQLELDFRYNETTREFNHMIQEAAHVVKLFREESREYLDTKIQYHQMSATSKEDHPSNGPQRKPLDVVPDTEEPMEEETLVNVFLKEDDWDYDEEMKTRSPNRPYIIHRDEFFANEEDYSQSSLQYYAGDNILCDEKDVPIYNPDDVVGKLEFGRGSQDPSIVYIRNDRLQAEYEVIFDEGYFQTEVLGQPVEDLKHSHRVLKFRSD